MKNREEIIKILMDNLVYGYCVNCKYINSKSCNYCFHKTMNWTINIKLAESIADAILS